MPRVQIPAGYAPTMINNIPGLEGAAAFQAQIPPNNNMPYGGRSQLAFLPLVSTSPPYTKFQRYELTYERRANGTERQTKVSTQNPQYIERAATPLQNAIGQKVYGTGRLRLGSNSRNQNGSVVSTQQTAGVRSNEASNRGNSPVSDDDDRSATVHVTDVFIRDTIDGNHRTFTRVVTQQHTEITNVDGQIFRTSTNPVSSPPQRLSIIGAQPLLLERMKAARPL